MIYLKYGSTVESFNELLLLPGINKTVLSSTTLRQRLIQKFVGSRRYWNLVLPPAEINNQGKFTFLENFFISSDCFISLDGTNWRAVITEDGDMSIEFLENAKFLPRFECKLSSVEPSIAHLVGWSNYV